MSVAPNIQFKNVCFSYSDQEVLHDVSFAVPPQSFVSIVGPNGGGKTTLLRLILGLEKPNQGQVRILGEHPAKARSAIGYVPQYLQYDKAFPITVLDLVLMGRINTHTWGRYSQADREIAFESLKKVGIEHLATRSFAALSGGQRQRVLVAKALAGNPGVLLLDEPTANIDAEGERVINELLHQLAQTYTVLVVSHNVNTVLDCSSHVLCVNRTVAMSLLQDLHPDLIAQARGNGIAVLHHGMHCQIFDRPDLSQLHSHSHPHSHTHSHTHLGQ